MPEPNAPPCLFLSHSGADTDAARELKRRLLDSPEARAAGLRIWLDKDDLAAGLGWQVQLEKAINEEATAFAVHVGRRAPGFAAVPQIWQIDYSTRRHIRRFAEGELYELPIGIK